MTKTSGVPSPSADTEGTAELSPDEAPSLEPGAAAETADGVAAGEDEVGKAGVEAVLEDGTSDDQPTTGQAAASVTDDTGQPEASVVAGAQPAEPEQAGEPDGVAAEVLDEPTEAQPPPEPTDDPDGSAAEVLDEPTEAQPPPEPTDDPDGVAAEVLDEPTEAQPPPEPTDDPDGSAAEAAEDGEPAKVPGASDVESGGAAALKPVGASGSGVAVIIDSGDGAAEPEVSESGPAGVAEAEVRAAPVAEPESGVETSAEAVGGADAVAGAEAGDGADAVAGAKVGEEEQGPADGADVATPAAAEVVEEEPGDTADGRRRQLVFMAAAVAVGLVVLVLAGWAVDATVRSGEVRRNVELAGHPVGGLDRAAVDLLTADLAAGTARRPVTIRSGDQTYELEAAALGLSVDEEATADAVFDVGRDGFVLLRPLSWASSWFGTDDVPVHYTVDEAQAAAALELAQGAARTAPVEPTMQLGDAGFALVPGQSGSGLDPSEVADALLAEAGATAPGAAEEAIVLVVEPTTLPPRFDDEAVQALADEANDLTAAGLTVHAGDVAKPVAAAQLRAWISLAAADAVDRLEPAIDRDSLAAADAVDRLEPAIDRDSLAAADADDRLGLAFDRDAATAALPGLVGSVGPGPVDATVTLDGAGRPVVVPARDGVTCCGDDAGDRVWEALRSGEPEVEVEVPVVEPERTTEEVQAWGIAQPIGGSRAWRSGGEVPGPAPGFTTYHACCASRVTNIHRIADLVRGAVVPPGGDFSINDHVGPRTPDKGFVLAGAIANGQHRDEYGGGVSQFATTTFNAAYFAGLDITSSQAHTEYFSRYPRGREATMGYPSPDLSFHNNTPYGLLIWTSYTETSLTVTIYSTPWATAEQTGISESSYGACRNVSTTRTRTYPDGTSEQDSFSATYRPGEGQFC